jgi:hypothetical protein
MKKILSLFMYSLPAAGLLVLGSCSKQIDEAYTNPNANVKQPIELLLPNIVSHLCISNTAQGANYGPQNDGQYFGRYIQYWATNTAGNQFDIMGQTTTNSTAAASDVGGNYWASHYYGMGQNITRVIEWGTEEKKWDYVGVAYAMRAWGWMSIADIHGEVIVKDAFDPSRLVFSYDEQKVAYDEAKRCLRLSLEYLNKSGDGMDEANLAKGAAFVSMKGSVDKWKKFANSLMARVFHRTTNKADYQPDSVIYYSEAGIKANADNAYVLFASAGGAPTTPTASFYGQFRGNIGTFRQTKFIADLLSGVNTAFPIADPRAWYLIRENQNGTFKGIRPGKGQEITTLLAPDQPQNFWGGAYNTTVSPSGTDNESRYVFRNSMPWPVITAAEMAFMKAEAYYRKNLKTEALAAYTNGISLNFDMLSTDYNAGVPTAKQITPAAKAAFLASTAVVPALADFNLSHIMLQKYIASYGFGFLETWVDMRRYHYVDVEANTTRQVYTGFTPPGPTELFANNNQKLVYRQRPRYNSEFLYNLDALGTIGAIALDYHTKKMWNTEP